MMSQTIPGLEDPGALDAVEAPCLDVDGLDVHPDVVLLPARLPAGPAGPAPLLVAVHQALDLKVQF